MPTWNISKGFFGMGQGWKDERILKYDYNNGFENLKIYNFCLKMHLSNSTKEIKSKDGARFVPLLVYSSPDYATRKVIKYSANKTYWFIVISIVYFEMKNAIYM